jgi:[NiFe] hydrogenase assembly HybE family chaperone
VNQEAHPRIGALVRCFMEIDATMNDLPLYNGKLEVEAWGFQAFGERDLLGVLITPWFMNLVMFPVEPQSIDVNKYGEAKTFTLPCGERPFLYGGDDAIGAFWAASLHSPMDIFVNQAQAKAEARLRLTEALSVPDKKDEVPEPTPGKKMSRRTFFRMS